VTPTYLHGFCGYVLSTNALLKMGVHNKTHHQMGNFFKKNEISDIKELNDNKNVLATILGTL
jgi:hypothetical protein